MLFIHIRCHIIDALTPIYNYNLILIRLYMSSFFQLFNSNKKLNKLNRESLKKMLSKNLIENNNCILT